MKNLFFLFAFIFLSGCFPSDIVVSLKNPKTNSAVTVSNIQVINHQIIITGTHLNTISNFNIKEGLNNTNLQIESQSATTIVANTISHVSFAAGKVFDFILADASASSTFTVNFSLCDSTLGGKAFNCSITPNHNEVLSYDAASGKWKPRAISGLSYQGSWDATTALPAATTSGDFYIVSVANGAYNVGDWIVYNGSTFDQVENSSAIVSVFGRTGVITATEGDYNLTKLSDVDVLTTPPTLNQVLGYNGTTWVPSTISAETDPTVKVFAQTTLPTCAAGQVLKANGTSLSCVTDAAGSGSFSGTINRIVGTDATGALAVTSITDTVLGYLSGVTSSVQTQLDAKLASASFVDWSTAGVQTIDPTRINLTTASRAVVTNASSTIVASATTATELGYVSGVTSAIQTQLAAKQGTVLTGMVSAIGNVAATDTVLEAFGKLLNTQTNIMATTVKTAGGSTTSPNGLTTIDGVALVAGDRVLITKGSDTGVYIAASGAWTLATDVASGAGLVGLQVVQTAGYHAGTRYYGISVPLGFPAYVFSTFSETSENLSIGINAGRSTSIGSNNVGIGMNTLNNLLTGSDNVAMGANALPGYSWGSLSDNTAVGSNAIGYSMMSVGSYNTAVGSSAFGGIAMSMNGKNTAIGFEALKDSSGSQNIAIGYQAGKDLNGGDYNVIIGSHSGNTLDFTSNNVLIADGQGNQRIRIDSSGRVGIATPSPSYTLHVTGDAGLSTGTSWTNASDIRLKDIHGDYEYGLNEILRLHTVRFSYKKNNPLGLQSNKPMTGFIAQEVKKVIPEAVTKNKNGFLEINVDPIHWAVVNAIKTLYEKFLDQSRAIASLEEQNAKLQKDNREVKIALCDLGKKHFCLDESETAHLK